MVLMTKQSLSNSPFHLAPTLREVVLIQHVMQFLRPGKHRFKLKQHDIINKSHVTTLKIYNTVQSSSAFKEFKSL